MNDPFFDSFRQCHEEMIREAHTQRLGKRLGHARGSGLRRILSRELERVSSLLRKPSGRSCCTDTGAVD
jgi:hypothetical protein